MAKAPARTFVCQSCGAVTAKWAGRCESCGEWNTIVEEAPREAAPKGITAGQGGRRLGFVGLKGEGRPPPRRLTGIGELDRVCGGGLVPGSALLVGGDPGIGKSTLLLQAAAALAGSAPVAYISGEEAVEQVRLRAARLGLDEAPVSLAAATSVRDIVASLDAPAGPDGPGVVVIDSIQTMYSDTLDSAPGTVGQVRTCAHELIRLAKRRGFTLFLVGHVTKEGTLAGPRVMEHMVDTVLYFEGERGHPYRILRAVKNRFGATDEIGVFEMTDAGLMEVDNPSALFLAERRGNVSGACVFAGIEGSRPMLVEIQALVAAASGGSPRRAVVGWDSGRLAMVLAVLEARCGLALAGHDVYLNVAGGLRIGEPAADLAVAAALVSAASDTALPADRVVFGEIGLSGELRPVSQTDARLKEAAKLGFSSALVPVTAERPRARRRAASPETARNEAGGPPLARHAIGHVQDLLAALGVDTAAQGIPAKGAGETAGRPTRDQGR
ncbi:DNA repair protein RadA [Roseospira navarrensis]|uniref:DNA repair protein RadA n=1 Tax=Roseospira navarrensis TaxID=140058 RepID=A0A7X1ZE85_9PROT|nr:DNA repair protein RadA [Roseospira navarrensis]MQX36929.1 DNA repair protein RadA [Roseospira navarrensis]